MEVYDVVIAGIGKETFPPVPHKGGRCACAGMDGALHPGHITRPVGTSKLAVPAELGRFD